MKPKAGTRIILSYEYKLDGTKQPYAAIETAIRIVQFIRNSGRNILAKALEGTLGPKETDEPDS